MEEIKLRHARPREWALPIAKLTTKLTTKLTMLTWLSRLRFEGALEGLKMRREESPLRWVGGKLTLARG